MRKANQRQPEEFQNKKVDIESDPLPMLNIDKLKVTDESF